MSNTEVTYGRTPLGQLVYDLLFVKRSDRYLAAKHKMPIAEVREARAAAERGFKGGKKRGKKRRR